MCKIWGQKSKGENGGKQKDPERNDDSLDEAVCSGSPKV